MPNIFAGRFSPIPASVTDALATLRARLEERDVTLLPDLARVEKHVQACATTIAWLESVADAMREVVDASLDALDLTKNPSADAAPKGPPE
jgi:hypothetical protein